MQSYPCAHHENVWGSGGVAALIRNEGSGCGEWSASRPVRCPPKEGAPDVHRIEGCVGCTRRSGPCDGEEMNDWPARSLGVDCRTCRPQRHGLYRLRHPVSACVIPFHDFVIRNSLYQDCTIPGRQVARSPWRPNFFFFLLLRLIFVGRQ